VANQELTEGLVGWALSSLRFSMEQIWCLYSRSERTMWV